MAMAVSRAPIYGLSLKKIKKKNKKKKINRVKRYRQKQIARRRQGRASRSESSSELQFEEQTKIPKEKNLFVGKENLLYWDKSLITVRHGPNECVLRPDSRFIRVNLIRIDRRKRLVGSRTSVTRE